MCNALYFNNSGRLDTVSSSSRLRSTSKISRNLDPMNVKKSPGDYRVSDFLARDCKPLDHNTRSISLISKARQNGKVIPIL